MSVYLTLVNTEGSVLTRQPATGVFAHMASLARTVNTVSGVTVLD